MSTFNKNAVDSMPSDFDLLSDIDHLQNITYGPSNGLEPIEIHTPTLMVHTLHSCYSHAIVDDSFAYYWIISELKIKYPEFTDFNLFIRKEEIFAYKHNEAIVDPINKCYTIESYDTLTRLLTNKKPLFEHLLDRQYKFKYLFIFNSNKLRFQRSPWNSIINYSKDRPVESAGIFFTDNLIYKKLNNFRNLIFNGLDLKYPDNNSKSLIIIERNKNRRFDNILFQSIVKEIQKTSLDFKGTYCLDEMNLKEQVELFSKTKVFIMRHGSSEINLLWIPEGSTVIEIGGGSEGIVQPTMYKRICKLTNSSHVYLDYNTLLNKAKGGLPLDFARLF